MTVESAPEFDKCVTPLRVVILRPDFDASSQTRKRDRLKTSYGVKYKWPCTDQYASTYLTAITLKYILIRRAS